MKELTLEQVKKIELDILIEVDKFCRQNNIRYSLAYGTLLGAVRHKGFIPWDDDIDICMPRPDFLRFMKEFKHPYYEAKSPENNEDWIIYFGKVFDNRTKVIEYDGYVWKCFIDVFPIDGMPSDIDQANAYYDKCVKKRIRYNLYRNNMEATTVKPANLKRFIAQKLTLLLNLFYPVRKALFVYLSCLKKYPYEYSNLCFDCALGTKRKVLTKQMVEDLVDWEFEGKKFYIPKEFDRVLTLHYGDYMKLPPVEERVLKHGFKAYWNERNNSNRR